MENEIIKYITEEAIVLLPVLFVIGLFLKKTPKVADWVIPWAMVVLGIAGAVLIVEDVIQGIIQGVLVAGATVLTHQLVKQTIERK